MLEELKRHREMVQSRIQKSFESDGLRIDSLNDEIFKSQEIEDNTSVNNLIKAGVLEFDETIEKAVYADTAENRKLGRVGQEYHRSKGRGQEEEPSERSGKISVENICSDINKYFEGDGIASEKKMIKNKLRQAVENSSVYDVAKKMIKTFSSSKFNSSSPAQSAMSDEEIKEGVESYLKEFGIKLDTKTKKMLSVSNNDEEKNEKLKKEKLDLNDYGYKGESKKPMVIDNKLDKNHPDVKKMFELQSKVDDKTASKTEIKQYTSLRNRVLKEKMNYENEKKKKLNSFFNKD